MLMQCLDCLFIEVTAADSRLVADDDHQQAGILEPFYRFRRTWDEREILDFMQVVFFDVDGAIAVEEYCSTGSVSGREE
jgi:hypothetical protein